MSQNKGLFSKNTFGGLAIDRQEINDRAGRKSDLPSMKLQKKNQIPGSKWNVNVGCQQDFSWWKSFIIYVFLLFHSTSSFNPAAPSLDQMLVQVSVGRLHLAYEYVIIFLCECPGNCDIWYLRRWCVIYVNLKTIKQQSKNPSRIKIRTCPGHQVFGGCIFVDLPYSVHCLEGRVEEQ